MHLSDFDYELPEELIAQQPSLSRLDSRLLLVNNDDDYIELKVSNLISCFDSGDILVLNDTKVLPARLAGKTSSGKLVELLIERIISENSALVRAKNKKSFKAGDSIFIGSRKEVRIVGADGEFLKIESESCSIMKLLRDYGDVPLPPYIKRKPEKHDQSRYQTIYATNEGAVAAPTAGLHITERFFEECREKGVEVAKITLHVGSGTYSSLRDENLENCVLHSERIRVDQKTCNQLMQAKKEGRRVIAVGTTVLRALESLYIENKGITAFEGETSLFIKPGFSFKMVDLLLTNFHLPKSSLFILVSAFAGAMKMKKVYQFAIENKFRFFSYGDCMILNKDAL